MRIKKIINNNILCAVDEKGNELIVTGRGIGFQRHRGEIIDTSLIEHTYRMEEKTGQRKLQELVEKIPIEHLTLTESLIEHITSQIPQKLNESLLITLADHISFAILRKAQGVEFSNPLKGSIMCYYPTEYHLGQYCLRIIREQMDVTLHEDEAAFIALHIVNAELNTNMSEMYEITKLIEDTISVVEYFYQKQFDRESLDFNRFVVHLRYFAQRLFQGKITEDAQEEQDELFHQLIMKNCKEHYKCAQCIADYIKNAYQKNLSDEELTYLTIHLKRINLGSKQ
ncbi:BglG family transcription antiterminator LicT [Anaerotignum sp.]|nr:PRD domain-containing protein [Anaerotignum sp.]MBQ7758400.1 PRD domain-containing protein [Anaerotignum sp.]